MRSETCSRFATLALSLFLSSNDTQNCCTFVESFSVTPRTNTNANANRNRRSTQHSYRYSSSSRSNNPRFRLQVANNPNTDFPEMSRMNYNDTSKTSFAESTQSLANPASLAEAERAWALDSSDLDVTESEQLLVTEERTLVQKLLSPDILGPIASILFTIAFLLYTLLNSSGIDDGFLSMDLSHKMDVLGHISWFPGQVTEAQLVVGLVMAFSAFAQALTGFGFAVVAVGAMSSMPWLLHSELYDVITPVAATLGALVGFILLIPFALAEGPPTEEEPGLDWSEIFPLLIPCTILTPLGIQLNSMIDPILGTRVLAALIMGFVAYKGVPMIQEAIGSSDADEEQSQPQLAMEQLVDTTGAVEMVMAASPDDSEAAPEFLQSRTAAILFGSAAGIFGGAFDVQGPPLCVYGDAKGWSPAQFRNNVLAVVCLNSAFVVAIDSFQGSLDSFYYSYFCLTSLPGVLLGVLAGQWASARIDPVLFKNLVLVMCLGLGIQLLRVS